MNLTDEQIAYIATNLEFYGVKSAELREDLLDHICTYIETSEFVEFDIAYKAAIQEFGGQYAMNSIQRQTHAVITQKKHLRYQRLVYIAAYISATLISSGAIFKIMHWPGASIMLASGFLVLILLFFPSYFYSRFKKMRQKISE